MRGLTRPQGHKIHFNMKKLRTIIFALMQLVAFFPMLIAQTPFIELKPSNYVLTADEMVAKEKILLPNMAESTWTIKINPIEQCLNGYNLTVQLPEWPEAIIFKADGVYSQALDD